MYLTGYPEWNVKTRVAYDNDKKGDKNMGSVTFYYEKLCKKTLAQLYYHKFTEKRDFSNFSITEIENLLRNWNHDNEFYFQCGAVFVMVSAEANEEGSDALNALIGSIPMFEDIIGLNEDTRLNNNQFADDDEERGDFEICEEEIGSTRLF